MPRSTDPKAVQFAQDHLLKPVLVVTTNGFAFYGKLVALEYDRSIMLRNVYYFVKIDDNAVSVPSEASHAGWFAFARREILIPGRLVSRVFREHMK